jgi:hypothetical protein
MRIRDEIEMLKAGGPGSGRHPGGGAVKSAEPPLGMAKGYKIGESEYHYDHGTGRYHLHVDGKQKMTSYKPTDMYRAVYRYSNFQPKTAK